MFLLRPILELPWSPRSSVMPLLKFSEINYESAGVAEIKSSPLGVGMIPRGEVELIAAGIGSAVGVASPTVYSLIVVLVLTTNLMTPLLLAYCHTGKELVPGMLPTAPSLGAGPDA